MKIDRYEITAISSEEIGPLVRDSLFSSSGFLNLWCQLGGRPVFWVAFHDKAVTAVLPGVEFGRRPLRRFYALPDGCYGRMACSLENGADAEVIASLLTQAISRAGYVKTHIFDFHNSLGNAVGFECKEFTTSLVDISGDNWLPPDKTLQSELRKAEREGVAFESFDYGKHFDRFLALMKHTETRHGRKPKYPSDFFAELARLAANDCRVVWNWCEYEGKAVTSHINLIEGDMVLNWQVYYDKQFSFLKANQYMLYRLARDVAAKGIKRLNLGTSPPEAASLAEYKKKWGGRDYTYKCYFRRSGLGKFI